MEHYMFIVALHPVIFKATDLFFNKKKRNAFFGLVPVSDGSEEIHKHWSRCAKSFLNEP
jgi:hypothetical protein